MRAEAKNCPGGKLSFVGIFILLLLAECLPAQRPGPAGEEPSPALRRIVPHVAAKYKIPGLAAAVIEHGRLRDVVLFGVSDKKTGAPVTESTVFEAASLSKPIFAYAVLELVAEHRLELKVPLTRYLPLPYRRDPDPFLPPAPESVDLIDDPRFNQITALDVLNHTSGMPNWARTDHLRLLFNPGEKWSYSGEGYVYLQRVVEHLTGEPLESFLERTMLGPFGMAHSSFVWRPEYASLMATGYDRAGQPVTSQRYARPVAATTLYTTVGDYARFVEAVLAGAPSRRVHESIVSLMLNPTVTVDSSLNFSWGLGWGIENLSGDLYFFHWGANPGFQSFVIASRKTRNGVVLFTNSENGLDAAQEIVQATLGGDHPIFKSPRLHPN